MKLLQETDDMEDFFSPSSYNNGELKDKESIVTAFMYLLGIPKQHKRTFQAMLVRWMGLTKRFTYVNLGRFASLAWSAFFGKQF